MEDKVSIIVPLYKSEPYIHTLLRSVINQTYKNLEIILIDDGSPDNCGMICDDYASKDERIVVKHKENAGGCSARNDGIDMATGKFIVFVDGDDWLSADFVEYMLNIIHTTNSDMALSKYNYTTTNLEQTKEPEVIEKWTSERAVVAITIPEIAIGCWNKMYKIELIKNNNIRFDVPWYGEGLYFSTMAAAYSNGVGVGNRKVYCYRRNNPESATTLYNVLNSKNAIWNIVNIKHKMPFKTKSTTWAIDQHIRGNYYEALESVIATNSIASNLSFFLTSWLKFVLYTPIVLLEGKYSIYEIKNMLLTTINPLSPIKKSIVNRLATIEKSKKDLNQ